MRLLWIAAITHVFDQESTSTRHRQQGFTRPLVRNVRGAHHQRRAGPPVCKYVDCAQRHVGLSRAALGHNPGRFGLAQVFCCPGNRQRLRGKRLAQKRRNAWRYWILGALQRRIGFENPFAEFDGVRP